METPFEHTSVPIAIVGMACRLPGADNLEQFWNLLVGGGSAIVELPHDRLDQELYYDPRKGQRGKTYSKNGAIISSRQFDNQACPIPKSLENAVDNAHLLMCQTVGEALRHAGFDPFNLALRNTGVYIGHAQGSNLAAEFTYGTCIEDAAQLLGEVPGFQQLSSEQQEAVARELVETVRAETPQRTPESPDVAINMVAGTISKAFGLTGPFVAVNSACASSLQAVMMGVRALQLGRIDMAIVGGASDCKSDSLVLFSHAQSMSESGSRPFDANADGLICSEGYVTLVLKTLPRALADGDRIQAVIRGLGMSSDGRGKSLWAPRKEGQIKAMERAYRHDVELNSLQYIEAHATSTNLGDATELNALTEVLGKKFPPGKKIPITSVKANIGHALEAAGVSSVIKTVLCLQHRTFVPAINIESLNTKIDWDKVPFYINREVAPWPEQTNGLPRRAGVNAFGIGGLNLHIVLEEFTESQRAQLTSRYKTNGQAAHPATPKSTESEAVAVIGIGCIFPGASHPAKFWELLTSGRDPKGASPPGRISPESHEPGSRRPYRTPTTLGGYITDFVYDWRKHKEPPKHVQQADPLQFMLLVAAEQALIDSGYDKKEFDRTRLGVLVGTEFGGDFSAQLELGLKLPHIEQILQHSMGGRGVAADRAAKIAAEFSDVMLKHWPALIDESGSFSTSTLASRITKTMNLMGGAAAIDSSDTSSAAALSASVDMLLSGDCDMMICAGGQRCMNLPQYEAMAINGVLALDPKPHGPFDTQAAGIVPGEGVGVLLLKRLSDARRDGDHVHAIIRGIGSAHEKTYGDSMRLAMDRSFKTAGLQPADVSLIEMDGTGLPQFDQEMLRAVVSTYGGAPRSEPLMVGSITGQIGHTMGASAMASLIKASLEIENGQLPATFGLESPLPIVRENSRVIQTATQSLPIRHTTHDGRRFAAISSVGKGLAYHILLERGEKVPVSQRTPTPVMEKKPLAVPPAAAAVSADSGHAAVWHICRFGAPTPAQLNAKLQQALANPAASFAAAAAAQFTPADRSRVAIVASSADAFTKKLTLAAKQFGNADAQPVLEQQGCFYREVRAARPRVAFLFPGQGSQYAGMLRELVRDVPAAAAAMREIDAVMTQRGYQTFGQMVWENPGQLGANIWVTQIAMLLADLIVNAAVVDFGIQPDLVASHSYGEFAALTAAGVWDIEGVITAARARYDAIEVTPSARGSLMATTAAPQLIEQLAASLRDRAYVANYNAADQTVVGGRGDTLKQLAELLAAQGHKAQILSVPCPYHTPLMAGSGEILKRSLDSLRLRAPRVPLLSSVTNRYVAEPEDIRVNLAAQLTTPVRYIDLVTRIAEEQETVFVEVGPQQALTKLNRRILEGRNVAGIIGCDNSKYPGVEQLHSVRALLDCLGVFDGQAATSGSPARAGGAKPAQGTISHFDATQRRIDKMRQAALKGGAKAPAQVEKTPTAAPKPAPAPVAPARVAPPAALNGDHASHAKAPAPAPRPSAAPAPAAAARPTSPFAPTANRAPAAAPSVAPSAPAPRVAPVAPVPVAQAPAAPAKQAATSSLDPAELEKFLINFVVEQTGYPPEVVELDADLEADLGIDSIKKAQLFGELAEYFDVQPTENMTLDDFPTLRHVLNFLGGATAKSALTTAAAPAPVAVAPAAPAPVAQATAPATQSQVDGPSLDPAELEKFLINFVVEQTGYPPEVVELDADLEADLGIDSIKKAQLFGELAEYFDVQPTENMTLDDFPTLRHVLNFLGGATAKSPLTTAAAPAPVAVAATAPVPAPVAQATAPAMQSQAAGPSLDPAELEKFLINFVVEQTGYPPEVVELDADLEADLGIDSIKKAQLFGELAEYFDVQPTENMTLDDFPTLRHVLNFLGDATAKSPLTTAAPAAAPAPVAAAPAAPAWQAPIEQQPAPVAPSQAAGPSLDPAELEKFLINFVVEQTGYPPEVVELDAELEADLGIDSIKKAQLFGELAEYFDVQPTENMTLDDFPTLRHVLNFLGGAAAKSPLTAAASVAVAAAPAPLTASSAAATWEAPALQASATAVQSRPTSPSLDPAELEKFLINFVVEQTGYPPEVVELDADLEADLGIDSIKKAQLFGELAEYFDVQPTENMTLDDFPTLRHVLNFLAGGEQKKNLTPSPSDAAETSPETVSPVESVASDGPSAPVEGPTAAPSVFEQAKTSGDKLQPLHLAGTPYEMGLEHGRQKKQEIRRILRRYVDMAGPGFDELPFDLESSDDLAKYFTPSEVEELRGIADAVQVPLTSILVHNLAVFSDLGVASLHFAVAAARNQASTLLHASSEQLPLSSALADVVQPVVQVRSPAGGIPHVVLSIAGAIGGLTGVNAHGLAITAGALEQRVEGKPALRGRMHAAITSHVLAEAICLDSAVELLQRYRNGAAWSACLSHYPTDRLRYVESDGRRLHVRDSKDTVIAANHSVLEATAEVPLASKHRWNQVKDLLSTAPQTGFTADQIRSLWSQAETNGKASTNGKAHAHHAARRIDVVMDPARGDFWVNPALSSNGKTNGYYRFALGELLPKVDPTATPRGAVVAPSAPYDLPGNDELATHRFATTIVDVPLDSSVPAMPQWSGAALIVGENALGDALRRQLEAAGVTVLQLPVTDDLDETLGAFERIWNEQPTPHVFLVAGRDAEAADPNDEVAWQRRWYRVAVLPYFLGQRWVQLAGQANLLPRCTFVGTTAMNGDFGFSGQVDRPEGAALTGLLKAVHVEVAVLRKQTGMRAMVVDAPDEESPELLAANICRELAGKSVDYAVAFVKGTRRLEYAVPEKATPRQFADVRPGGTWVFTGGARGITAECALELGRRFGLKLHLIGTSPLRAIDPAWRNLSADELKALKLTVMRDARAAKRNMDDDWARVQKDIEIDRSLRAFADAGVEATYHACDVANGDAMAAVLDTIRQQSGPIEGIVHGAGIERAGIYERKLRDAVMATLAAKVDGALNLMRLTRQDPVRWFIGFGSVSGRMGSNGQTDYCLASDMLCKLAGWYRGQRAGVHSVGIHWHPWDEVGMAARPETITMLKMTDGPGHMSKQEGINHLLREMYAGAPISEVLITTWDYHGRFYGTEDHPKPGDEDGPSQSPTDSIPSTEAATPIAPPAPVVKPARPAPQAKWDPVPFVPLTYRSELRMVAAPLPAGSAIAPQWQGPAVIMGHNAAAFALRDRLQAAGVPVHMLPDTKSPEEAAAAMDTIYASGRPRYLFLMSGRDTSNASLLDHAGWLDRRAAGVVVPFMAAQQWFRLRMKAKDTTPITIVAATTMGGDFALSSHVATPEGGAICGMLKSIYVEDTRRSPSEVRVKVIDAPADEAPATLVDAIFRELAANDPYVEVGWSRGARSVIQSFARPVESLPKTDMPHGGTWVVTGGARGVTAAAAFELGKRFGIKLHLIGRSRVPRPDSEWRDCTPEKLNEIKAKIVRQAVAEGRSPEPEWDAIKSDIEIDETLKKFAAAGVQATYYSCDLSNWAQLATILDQVRRQDGPIQGIMHGAGFARSGKFGTRSRDLVERTLAGKLDGAVGLMSLTRNDPVRYFLGFGSISGRYGGNGLSEYATSNEMLAKLIDWYRSQRPDCAACCMHWQSWDEIGMAMLGDSAVGTKGILKMAFIPPKEGVEHLCRELEAGLPASEVLIGDGFFERTFYPFVTCEGAGGAATVPSGAAIGRVPLVEKIGRDTAGHLDAEIHFQPAADPFLIDHKLRGKPLLPAVIGMEAVAEAAALASGKTVTAIRDVQLIEGFLCHSDQPIVGRIRVTNEQGTSLSCELLSDFRNRAGMLMKKDRVHLRATAEVAERASSLDVPMPEPPTEWHPVIFQHDGPLVHGPALHGLKAAIFDTPGGWGQLVAMPMAELGGQRTGHDWLVPATLIDAGFYVCGIHCYFHNEGAFSLPSSIEAVHLGRRPRDNEKCLVAFTCREIQPEHAIYDFTVFGDDRSVIVRVDGHRVITIK